MSPLVVVTLPTTSDPILLHFQQEEDLEPHERVRLKKLKAIEDSSEEEEDDGESGSMQIARTLDWRSLDVV